MIAIWHLVGPPAALAFVVAIAATVAVERFGGRLGGVLASIPTTIVPASLGMIAHTDAAGFQAAMAMVPAGMLVDAAFLWTWRLLPPRLTTPSLAVRLVWMSTISLAVWAAGAALFVVGTEAAARAGVPPRAIGATALVVLVAAGVAACWDPPPAPKGSRPVALPMLLARGTLAATAIAVSVAIAAWGAPLAGGMASVFPAIFLTTMVSLWVAQGEAVPLGAVGPIMLGSSSVGVYALVATWAQPTWGAWPGAGAAWLAAVALASTPAALFLRHRRGAT